MRSDCSAGPTARSGHGTRTGLLALAVWFCLALKKSTIYRTARRTAPSGSGWALAGCEGPQAQPGRHAKSDRRARTTCRGGHRSSRAARHWDRTRTHDQIGPGGDLVRQRQRACRPKSGRLTTRRVRRRARLTALRSTRSAAGATRSWPAGPRPTCLLPMPSSSANGPPEGARGQLKYLRSNADRSTVGE